jgi:adenylate cyclase
MAELKVPAAFRPRFPLALKLSLAVSAALVFSLGAVIFSVWAFVGADLRDTARTDNDNINYRVAAAADTALRQMEANTGLLVGGRAEGASGPVDRKQVNYFFALNPEVAALMTVEKAPGRAFTYINTAFTRSSEIDESAISAYVWLRGTELIGGEGNADFPKEPALFNAAPDFHGIPILAARFPGADGGLVFVFFSAEALADYFGSGASRSVMVNRRGDLLIHPGPDDTGTPVYMAGRETVTALFSGGGDHLAGRYRGGDGSGFASVRRTALDAAVLTTVSDNVVLEGIRATTIRNIYFALSVCFLSLLLIRFFSGRLTRQLGILGRAAEAIEDGRYDDPIPVKTNDETGFLAETMNSMRLALLNFERFTNKEIARLTRKGLLGAGGGYKKATFFFSDIRSFTAISEKLDPAAVVEFLNDYMERMVTCVLVTGGAIDKFIGDAIMAHWGAVREGGEGSEAEDALAAIRAALLMRVSLQCYNRGRGEDKRPRIKIGCGINSGTAVAGQIGTGERLEYTVIGNAVTLAERIESFNKLLGTEILITEHTWRLAGRFLVTEEMPGMKENGRNIRLFGVLNIQDPGELNRFFGELERLPDIDMETARRFAGPQGPQTLGELRERLGIREPDLSKVTLDGREKKYQVQTR